MVQPVWMWMSIALAVLFAAGGAAALWAWSRRKAAPGRRRVAPTGPRYPIVLAHGLMGFDVIRVGRREAEYFRGIPQRLRRGGASVHVARVPAAAGIARRAEALAGCIRALPSDRVNVVAHSMGGLDARYAIAQLGLARRVASVVTIGAPHRGTAIADVGTNLVGDGLGLKRALSLIGLDVAAFSDITTREMKTFNELNPDVDGVAYGFFEATVKAKLRMNPLLLAPYLFLSERDGANDGLVAASSQAWGECWGEIEADHWAQIGWSKRFDAPAFFAAVAEQLRERGF
jgi:triacylglycerol lipase